MSQSTSQLSASDSSGSVPQIEIGIPKPLYLDSINSIAQLLRNYATDHYPGRKQGPVPIDSREVAHIDGQCYSPLNGKQPIFALVSYQDIQTLEGRLLTLVDASFPDREQRKAFKDLVRQAIWWGWVGKLDTDDPSHGIPNR